MFESDMVAAQKKTTSIRSMVETVFPESRSPWMRTGRKALVFAKNFGKSLSADGAAEEAVSLKSKPRCASMKCVFGGPLEARATVQCVRHAQ
eukprot:759460-Rhodomonas_salina.1